MRKGTLTKLVAVSAVAVMAFSSMTVFAEESIYVTERAHNPSKIAQKNTLCITGKMALI